MEQAVGMADREAGIPREDRDRSVHQEDPAAVQTEVEMGERQSADRPAEVIFREVD